ncbi:MAG: class I SAM-dependent methyltransferase family protein [Nanoarchaeota archaeon]
MPSLKSILKNKIPDNLLHLLPSSYDIIGDIVIFADFPKELAKYERIISKIILSHNKNIRVIAKKTKKYSGRYRLPKFKVIEGEKKLTTNFKENGCRFKIDLEKCYFSPRLSNERKRIASLVKPNERVLVMFSGIGVYPITIAKNSQAEEILGVEINKSAHEYALENVKLNKANNVKLFLGDVKKIVPKFRRRFDRIIMPLPKGAKRYLPMAFSKIKKYGFIHFYDFERADKFDRVVKKIETSCKKAKKKFKVINLQKCGQYAPRVFRVCVDCSIES